jgi:ABC-type hemin transport system ATPase subunit
MQVVHDPRARPLLEVRDVSVRRCGHSLVQRVSLTVDRGELLVLLGGAGSGTDTLLEILGGVVRPDAGRILRRGGTPLTLTLADAASRETPVAIGPEHAAERLATLDVDHDREVVLLDQPAGGLTDEDAHALLASCRQTADNGRAVVVTTDRADLAASHATTIALFVAGRLLSWGTPGVALVPALQLLSAGSCVER